MCGVSKLRLCVLSLGVSASVHATSQGDSGSHGSHLAALAERMLPPYGPLPEWVSGPPADEGQGGSEGSGSSFSDVTLQWLNASSQHNYPHPHARGWRLVRTAPTDSQEWCLTRLEFLKADETEVRPDTTRSCRVEAYGQDLIVPSYAPRNVFHDDGLEGCTLRNPVDGAWAIGLVCDDVQEVDSIKLLQMTHSRAASQVQLQQMHAGRWMNVGAPIATPTRHNKVIFEAAKCDESICGDRQLKAAADLPVVCLDKTCSKSECCAPAPPATADNVELWSASPLGALSGARASAGAVLGVATLLVALGALVAVVRARSWSRDLVQLEETEVAMLVTEAGAIVE